MYSSLLLSKTGIKEEAQGEDNRMIKGMEVWADGKVWDLQSRVAEADMGLNRSLKQW